MNLFFSLKPWVQVSFAGIATGLAFFPLNLGFLAWVSFIPLFHVFINSSLKKNLCSFTINAAETKLITKAVNAIRLLSCKLSKMGISQKIFVSMFIIVCSIWQQWNIFQVVVQTNFDKVKSVLIKWLKIN